MISLSVLDSTCSTVMLFLSTAPLFLIVLFYCVRRRLYARIGMLFTLVLFIAITLVLAVVYLVASTSLPVQDILLSNGTTVSVVLPSTSRIVSILKPSMVLILYASTCIIFLVLFLADRVIP